jgi:hypothetical protein
VIAVAPRLEDRAPFPTTFWLTCPRLVEAVAALESTGEGAAFAARAASDASFAAALIVSDAAYRAERLAVGDGHDPCGVVGVAGQRDPLAVKCLHARLAAHLAGIADPIGAEVAETVGRTLREPCVDTRCAPPVTAG